MSDKHSQWSDSGPIKKRTTAALVVYLIAIPKHAVFFVISLPCIISEWLLIIMVGFRMCLGNHPQLSFENKTKCLYKPCLIIWTGHFVNSNSIIMSMIQLGKIKLVLGIKPDRKFLNPKGTIIAMTKYEIGSWNGLFCCVALQYDPLVRAVSYTHLTLPTIYSV